MPGERSDALKLVAVRLPPEAVTVLAIAAAAYDKSTQELLRPVLQAEADRLLAVPEIKRMVTAALELRARESGKPTRPTRPSGRAR